MLLTEQNTEVKITKKLKVTSSLKVTVQVGTDQNSKLRFSQNILNELLVKKIFFNMSNRLRDMTNESFYRE